jgi:hypothetical protein
MRIHQTNDPHSEYKLLQYSDIKDVRTEPISLKDKMVIQERWSFKFDIYCTQRTYTLYAPSVDEKHMWYHTFKWIVECNFFEKDFEENESFKKSLKIHS